MDVHILRTILMVALTSAFISIPVLDWNRLRFIIQILEKEEERVISSPTYITNYQNARSVIKKLERDELLEEMAQSYLEERK